jgi:hypothetical protein
MVFDSSDNPSSFRPSVYMTNKQFAKAESLVVAFSIDTQCFKYKRCHLKLLVDYARFLPHIYLIKNDVFLYNILKINNLNICDAFFSIVDYAFFCAFGFFILFKVAT